MTAENPGATPSFQTTQYVYGNAAAVGYGIFSNDLMSKVMLPDPTTGHASGAHGNFETYGYGLIAGISNKSDEFQHIW